MWLVLAVTYLCTAQAVCPCFHIVQHVTASRAQQGMGAKLAVSECFLYCEMNLFVFI